MGVIKLEYVIRYSSQDNICKAENLLHSVGTKPWLCSIHDQSGYLEAEFQLDKASCIDFIDIGNYGSSTFEIQVGKSSFQQSTSYVSFLPAVGLLTSADIKTGINFKSVCMFTKDDMDKNVAEEKWDRVKVICCQPYNKKAQFGLSFLSLRSKENMSKLNIDDNFITDRSYERFPKCLPGNSSLEAESLMTRGKIILNASKSKKNVHRIKMFGQNNALKEDAVNFLIACTGEFEGRNISIEDYLKEFEQQSQRTLGSLEKELFCDNFKVILNNNGQILQTCENNSLLTNESSFYNLANSSFIPSHNSCIEKHNSFIFNDKVHHNSRKRSAHAFLSGLTASPTKKFPNSPELQYVRREKKQQRMDKNFIQDKAGVASAPSYQVLQKQNKQQKDCQTPVQTKISSTRPEDFIQPDGIQPSTSSGITFIDCPVCRESFMTSEIEKHASICGDPSESPESTNEDYFKCPLCTEMFPESLINFHAEQCLNKY